jgi:hypothetical protein
MVIPIAVIQTLITLLALLVISTTLFRYLEMNIKGYDTVVSTIGVLMSAIMAIILCD